MAIVVYLLYRFIVNFLVPVMRATRQVRQQFRNMQDQANGGSGPSDHGASHGGTSHGSFQPGGGFRPGAAPRPGAGEKRSSGKPPAEDYIDFEEIK
jgi:hypothetical protein